MASDGNNGIRDDDTTTAGTYTSDDIIHRLQDLSVGTSNATVQLQGATSGHPPPPPPPVNNAGGAATTQTRPVTACSGGMGSAMAISKTKDHSHRRNYIRRLQRYQRRHHPSIDSITDELQTLVVRPGGSLAFRPTPHELVGRFLCPKIAGRPLPATARFIHDADVYSAAPEHLAATHAPAPAPGGATLVWYFFSPLHYMMDRHTRSKRVPCRRVGGSGTWLIAGGNPVKLGKEGEAAANWYSQRLVYNDFRQRKSSSGLGKEARWRMSEYGIFQEEHSGRQQPLVLCEVYRER